VDTLTGHELYDEADEDAAAPSPGEDRLAALLARYGAYESAPA